MTIKNIKEQPSWISIHSQKSNVSPIRVDAASISAGAVSIICTLPNIF